jgi:MoaA/NifB/PqqE/SkfB family radical SAM enzyme
MSAIHLLNLASNRLRTLPIIIFYLTDGCNSRCVTCDIWRSPRRNMRLEIVDAVAAESQALGIRWAVLSGGEAMQHPQWAEAAARLRAEGLRVILLTNGLFLKKEADAVIACVDEIVVSLDGGTPQTYQAIRGVDAFDLVLEGIRAVRAGGIPATTRTVVQRANYRELPAIIHAAKSADVTSISFLPVDVSNPFAFGERAGIHQAVPPSALTSDDLPILSGVIDALERDFAADFAARRIAEPPEKLRRMVDHFAAVLGQKPFSPPRCNAPHLSVVIEVDGGLRPCYFLPRMGKLNGAPLAQAINASDALALRAAYRAGARSECAGCVCPLYKGAGALLRL